MNTKLTEIVLSLNMDGMIQTFRNLDRRRAPTHIQSPLRDTRIVASRDSCIEDAKSHIFDVIRAYYGIASSYENALDNTSNAYIKAHAILKDANLSIEGVKAELEALGKI